MSLAQVVYSMSTDKEFAAQWNLDPETALLEKGIKLGREEMVFLPSGLRHGHRGDESEMRLSDLALISRGWK